MEDYIVAQREKRWAKDIEDFNQVDNPDLRVGILGLGVMGAATADLLLSAGYSVSAWTRSQRERTDIR